MILLFLNRNSDPDKSDTPLLCESVQSPDNDTAPSGWLKSTWYVIFYYLILLLVLLHF